MHHALDLRILTGDIHCFFKQANYSVPFSILSELGTCNRKCGGEGGEGLNFELKRYGPIFIVAYIMDLSFFF